MPYAGGLLKVMPGSDLSSLAYRIETFLSEDHNLSGLDLYEKEVRKLSMDMDRFTQS
jgi:hypothetical protein